MVLKEILARADRFKKRLYNEVEDEERRVEDPIRSVEQMIFNLGNRHPTLTPSEDIRATADLLSSEYGKAPEQFAHAISCCILELPQKLDYYVQLLVLLHGDTQKISLAVLENVSIQMQLSAANGPWRHFTQAIRFFADCTSKGILSKTTFAELAKCLLKSAKGASTDFALWNLAASLPLLGGGEGSLIDVWPSMEFDLSLVYDERCKAPLSLSKDLKSLWSFKSSSSPKKVTTLQVEPISIPLEITTLIVDEHWDGDFVPLELFPDAFTKIDGNEEEEEEDEEEKKMLMEMEKNDAFYEKWEIFYWCRHLVESMELNHRRCADILLTGLPEIAIRNSEKIIVEFLFGELIRNRTNRMPCLVYETLLMDCCRQSRTFPPIMAKGLQVLYERLDELGFVATDRLASWFSHHLSNFDCKWNWLKWSNVLTVTPSSMQYVFVRFALEKLVRLSYYDRVIPTLPEEFRKLLPLEPNPNYKFASTSNAPEEEVELAARVTQLIQNRQPVEEVRNALGDVIDERLDSMQREVLLQSLLYVGSKSLSHLLAIVEKYLPLFRLLLPPHGSDGGSAGGGTTDVAPKLLANIFILDQLTSFWQNSMLHFEFIVERLINYRILLPKAIIQWSLERADEQLSDVDSTSNFYQTITHVLGRGLLLRTIQQAAMMPAVAKAKMRDQPEEKVSTTVANLQVEFEETLGLALQGLAGLSDRLVAPEEIILSIELLTIDLVREIVSLYPHDVGKVAKSVTSQLGRKIPLPILEALQQAHLQP